MTEPDRHLWVTVLAGGIGSRFWPASTPAHPKQLLPLASDRPLVVDTVDRALGLAGPERLRILASPELAETFRGVLPELPPSSYWLEPEPRGTAPVLAWAAWKAMREDPEAVLVSLHSDHLIEPRERFLELVRDTAALSARDGLLMTIGIPPARPDTGFGYIRPSTELEPLGSARGWRVDAFVEKPDGPTARRYLDEGYLWNSGIFIWPAALLLEEVGRHAPGLHRALRLLDEGKSDADFFRAAPKEVIDRAILERSDRVGTVAATFRWDDVGSWNALERSRDADPDGNVSVGPALAVGSRDCITFTDGAPIVLWGVEGLVAVRVRGMTLVLPKDRAPDLKELLDELPEDWREPDTGPPPGGVDPSRDRSGAD